MAPGYQFLSNYLPANCRVCHDHVFNSISSCNMYFSDANRFCDNLCADQWAYILRVWSHIIAFSKPCGCNTMPSSWRKERWYRAPTSRTTKTRDLTNLVWPKSNSGALRPHVLHDVSDYVGNDFISSIWIIVLNPAKAILSWERRQPRHNVISYSSCCPHSIPTTMSVYDSDFQQKGARDERYFSA